MFFRFIPIGHQCLVAFSDVFILFAFKATIREDSSLFKFYWAEAKIFFNSGIDDRLCSFKIEINLSLPNIL